MAGSLSQDDQLLGEKMHYYCSSSEDEYASCEEGEEDACAGPHSAAPDQPQMSGSSGNSINVRTKVMQCIDKYILLPPGGSRAFIYF